MLRKNRQKESKRPLVYVLLAKAYDTDTRVIQEVNSLIGGGFRVYVLAWDRDNTFKDTKTDYLKVKHLTLIPSKLFNKIVYILSALLLQIAIILRGSLMMIKEPQIIIHANDFNTLPAGAILKFLFPKSIRLIYDSHEHTPAVYEEWFNKRISKIVSFVERIFIKFADATITVSQPIKEYLQTIFKKEIHIVQNYPVQTVFPRESKEEARTKLGYKDGQFLATFIGVMRMDIAIPEIVEAAKILKETAPSRKRKIKIILVGDGPLFQYVQEKRIELDLWDYIDITGRVERELALIYLKASDLSLILIKGNSYNSKIGSPWKLFESLTSNVPVMVKKDTNMAEIAVSCNAGVVLNKINGDTIASNLIEQSNHSNSNFLEVSELFTWESQEDYFVGIYKNV